MFGWTVKKERMSGVERCREMVHHASWGRFSTMVNSVMGFGSVSLTLNADLTAKTIKKIEVITYFVRSYTFRSQ